MTSARLVAAGEEALAASRRADGTSLADELQRRVAHQRARQHPRLGQHLEAVADAEHRRAARGPRLDLAHDRRLRRHGAAAQIVAVGKAAGNDDQIDRRQIGVAVPDLERRLAETALQRVEHVALAVGAGKNDDGGLHGKRFTAPARTRQVCLRDARPVARELSSPIFSALSSAPPSASCATGPDFRHGDGDRLLATLDLAPAAALELATLVFVP